MKKLILAMVIMVVIVGSGCIDIFKIEVIQTPTPIPTPISTSTSTPSPTPVPINPEVRTVDITVNYEVKSLGITLYDDSYTYRLENTTMTDDEIQVKVGEKVREVAQDKNIDPDRVTYECLIVVVRR
ncbi:hypothetical protein KAW18_02350 [candidate division WOR-3 bacterium]|nr:hypothetical protein [candidate division WOR-3 bacterium]